LVRIIRDKFMIPAIAFNKIQGMPFTAGEIFDKIEQVLSEK